MSEKYTGVYTATKKDNSIYYRASLTYRNKHISLGSYNTFQEANDCYLFARRLLETQSVTISQYLPFFPIRFDKYVILINLRDNGYYFSTPIYLYSRYFLYYITKDQAFKFDRDDLFYYSSHKIMVRQGHLFVSDYGMQVNILNRYGIKNYAVIGRDYDFKNGDRNDFRYENVIIYNTYHGVSSFLKKGVRRYKVRIHLVGDYIVGTYKTPEEAAIAYNKAIDILQKNGVNKNYTVNYIPDLSPKEYADLYSRVKISPRIITFNPQK